MSFGGIHLRLDNGFCRVQSDYSMGLRENEVTVTHQSPFRTTPPSPHPSNQTPGARRADRDTKTTVRSASLEMASLGERNSRLFFCRSRPARESWHRTARSKARRSIANVVGSRMKEKVSCSCGGRRRLLGCRRRCCRRSGGRGRRSRCSL